MKILLDAGHGAGSKHNRGSLIANEGDNNFYYSLALKKELEKYTGVSVGLTRNNINNDPTVASRSSMGKGYDLFLSLHSNAYHDKNVNGIEIFDSVEKTNKKLATQLCNELAKLFRANRGVKYRYHPTFRGRDYYGVLRGNGAKSSMLIEHGFHTNEIDVKVYVEQRDQLAKITADVIAKHYGLAVKTDPTLPDKEPVLQTKYRVGDLVSFETLANMSTKGAKIINSRDNSGTITKVYEGRPYPYRIGTNTGFVSDKMIKGTIIPDKPKEPVKPAKCKEYVVLDKSVKKWGFYKLNVYPKSENIFNYIYPERFGGLTYEILGKPYANTVTIQTRDYGKVNIWIGAKTPHKIIKK